MQRSAIIIISLFTSLIFSLSARAADPVAEIPYRIDYEGWITISAMVNGEGPYDFVVDSGATITATFQNLADDHDFTPADRDPIRILGLAGAEALPAFYIGAINVGGQDLTEHVGVVLPNWRRGRRTPGGVLGLDFLTRYRVWVDADRRVIRLYDKNNAMSDLPRGWSKTSLKGDDYGASGGTLYKISVNMHGRRVECIIDLGASGTIINYYALRRLLSGVFFNESKSTGFSTGSRLNDIFDNTEIARNVRIARIRIAGAQWRKRVILVFDALIFEELGISRKPYCLIGSDLMTEYNFMFDFANEKLYMGPKARRVSADTG